MLASKYTGSLWYLILLNTIVCVLFEYIRYLILLKIDLYSILLDQGNWEEFMRLHFFSHFIHFYLNVFHSSKNINY